MPNTMKSVEVDNTVFNVGDLCIITEGGNHELSLFNSNRMRIDKIYSNPLGVIKVHLFDDRFKTHYGTVIVYTPISKPHLAITKLKKLNIKS